MNSDEEEGVENNPQNEVDTQDEDDEDEDEANDDNNNLTPAPGAPAQGAKYCQHSMY